MDRQGLPISKDLFHALLQGSAGKKDLSVIRKACSWMFCSGLDFIVPLCDQLIRLFADCRSLQEARNLFSRVSAPSIYTWNSIISAHIKLGEGLMALQLYEQMQLEGVRPDRITRVYVLQACGSLNCLGYGRQLHNAIIRDERESDVVLANNIMDVYVKCGSLLEARRVFELLPAQDLISWTVLISGYVAQEQGLFALILYKDMQVKGVKPNIAVIVCLLKACGDITAVVQGGLIHGGILEAFFEVDVVVMSSLVDMYARCGRLEDACRVFKQMPSHDVVSWGIMIDGLAQHGSGLMAIEVFNEMQEKGIEPNKVTFLGILKSCTGIQGAIQGRIIHAQIVKRKMETDVTICSTLVDMYSKGGSIEEAYKVFQGQTTHNVVSCGAMITGFCHLGHDILALEFYSEMQQEAIVPNRIIYLCVLKACCNIEALEQGSLIHHELVQSTFGCDTAIENTLIDMYAKCGRVEDAQKVFMNLESCDAVSWAILISGYYHQGNGASALDLFEKMYQENIKPKRATFLCTLNICSSLGLIGYGKLVHYQIISCALETDLLVKNTLVDFYAKIGRLDDACKTFSDMSSKDLVTCGAMITGHAQEGDFEAVTRCLCDMHQSGLKPDRSMFTSILAACSNGGFLEEACGYFKSMRDEYALLPDTDNYSCVIDLLGRAGKFDVAEDLFQTMPMQPDFIMWTSLLASCKTYSNLELGRRCFAEVMQLDSVDSSGYLLMSNLCSDAHNWEDVYKLQELRKSAGAWKEPGRAWIEVDKIVYEFLVVGTSHAGSLLPQEKLTRLSSNMKGGGFVPQVNLVSPG